MAEDCWICGGVEQVEAETTEGATTSIPCQCVHEEAAAEADRLRAEVANLRGRIDRAVSLLGVSPAPFEQAVAVLNGQAFAGDGNAGSFALLASVQAIADRVLAEAVEERPEAIRDEAVNWADLRCTEVLRGEGRFVCRIEEADPDARAFRRWFEAEMGKHNLTVEAITEW